MEIVSTITVLIFSLVDSRELESADDYLNKLHNIRKEKQIPIIDIQVEYANGYYHAVADVGVEIPKSMFWGKLDGDFATEINKYLVDESTITECIADTITIWSSYIDTESDIIREKNTRESTGIPGYPLVALISILSVSAILVIKKRK